VSAPRRIALARSWIGIAAAVVAAVCAVWLASEYAYARYVTPIEKARVEALRLQAKTDAEIQKITVTGLKNNTFYAALTLLRDGEEIEVDARPSDALALAVRTDAPIFAADDLIDENAIEFEHEVDDTEDVVERFRDFLDKVSPEDFATALGVSGDFERDLVLDDMEDEDDEDDDDDEFDELDDEEEDEEL